VTTIDTGLQKALKRAVEEGARDAGLPPEFDLRGAAVVLDLTTGAILALDSRPTFGLAELGDVDDWAVEEARDRRAGFRYRRLNRVIEGSYPPGSVFKTVTALAALESELFSQHSPVLDYRSGDKGPRAPDGLQQLGRWHEIRYDNGSVISCGNHPDLKDWRFDLESAFAWSCNVAFAEIGAALDAERLVDMAHRLGFEREIEVNGLGNFRSTLDNDSDRPLAERFLARSPFNVAETAFGQGQILTSPLQMALVAAAVGNDGKVMLPYLIDGWQPVDGPVQKRTEPTVLVDARLNEEASAAMKAIMKASATYGWASTAAVTPGNAEPAVAGKTGSAEWSDGMDAPHAWFLGYFPAERPRIALALVVERGEAGPVVGVTIARYFFGSDGISSYLRAA
jgi:peptidoglycan glycosyltransferase